MSSISVRLEEDTDQLLERLKICKMWTRQEL